MTFQDFGPTKQVIGSWLCNAAREAWRDHTIEDLPITAEHFYNRSL